MRTVLTIVACLLLVSSCALAAESDSAPAAAAAFPTGAAPDSLRTNLWLSEAMMGEIVEEMVAVLPPGPMDVSLRPAAAGEESDLFLTVAHAELARRGYRLFLDESRSLPPDQRAAYEAPDVDLEIRFSVEDLSLTYPAAGRRFGLWRQWVDRELDLTVIVTVLEQRTGRMLIDRRLSRTFGDRVPSDLLDHVESKMYPFTAAEVSEGGWRGLLEQIVVIGALTGLITVYFANSGS